MPSNKFEQVIKSLNPRERREARKWLIFQKHDQHEWVRFYDLMLRGSLSDEAIWEKLETDKPFVAGTFRSLRTRVMEAIETWLAVKRFEEDTLQRDMQALWALESRLDTDVFMQEYRKVRNRIGKEPASREQLYTEYRLVLLLVHHYARQDNYQANALFTELEQSYDRWLLSEKLLQKLSHIAYQDSGKRWTASAFTDFAFSHTDDSPELRETLLIDLYFQCCLMRMGRLSEEEFDALCLKVKQHAHDLRPDVRRDMYALINNHFNKLNQGNEPETRLRYYEWQKWGVESGAVLYEGKLGPILYRNLIVSACRVGNFAEATTFLHDLKDRLNGGNEEEDFEFCQLLITFYKKDYHLMPSIEKLKQFRNDAYRYQTRMFVLVALYERVAGGQEEARDRESLLGPATYVRNRLNQEKDNIWPARHALEWMSFVIAYQHLCKAYMPEEWKSLAEDVESEPFISHRVWLLEKIQEGPSRWS